MNKLEEIISKLHIERDIYIVKQIYKVSSRPNSI